MPTFATAINCIDGRAQIPIIEYLKTRHEADYVDMINAPGINGLIAHDRDAARIEAIRNDLRISLGRPGRSFVAVCAHDDCLGNPVDEAQHKDDVRTALARLKEWHPRVEMISVEYSSPEFKQDIENSDRAYRHFDRVVDEDMFFDRVRLGILDSDQLPEMMPAGAH